jgi:polyhydroxyalkanoate synthase
MSAARTRRPTPASKAEARPPVAVDAVAELAARAAEALPGPNPIVGLPAGDVVASAAALLGEAARRPFTLLEHEAALARELASVLAGRSELAPAPGDKRFTDPAWTSNRLYRGLMQGHLAWTGALADLVERLPLEKDRKERARFVAGLIGDALAPTNTLLGNPASLKKALDTGGASLVQGARHLVRDLRSNRGMPVQVDKDAFEVGRNLALTPGAVVLRTEVLELIQYRPKTATVHARPHLLVPPQINKYYVFDLAPGKSMIEFLVDSGFQVFAISWRNPGPAQRDWGMDTYASAVLDAIAAVRAITGADDVNLHGACSGAMTMSALMGHLAATGKPLVHAASLMVAVLDGRADSQLGTFVTPRTIAAAKRRSAAKGVLGGREMGRVFAWMRPNDLVWNYWVNNVLLGNPPPAFDILYWNNDSTQLPARFHAELLDAFAENRLVEPGALEVLGTPIDLSSVECDTYLVAGITDHITPWKGVYDTAQAFGGKSTFVLSSSGHIQSLVNPPGNPKSKFLLNAQPAANADEWLAGARTHEGSWWTHWRDWLEARSGERIPAPKRLGNRKHPVLGDAPGTYVRA